MMYVEDYDAVEILTDALDSVYLNDVDNAEEWDQRWVQLRGFTRSLRDTPNLKIQMDEPHLILWDTVKVHKGITRKKTEQAKIGRWLSRTVPSMDINLTDAQIEAFVNIVKSEAAASVVEIELISGDEIREAYHEINSAYDSGNLLDSCMRYEQCQPFFDIFTDNPDTVALAVIRDGYGYSARALVWTDINGKKWLDRTYASDKNARMMKTWAESQGIEFVYEGGYESRVGVVVHLKNGDFDHYPYMDSMYNLCKRGGQHYLVSGGGCYGSLLGVLRSTEGGPFNPLEWCGFCNENFAELGSQHCEYCAEYMIDCQNCTNPIHEDHAVWIGVDNDAAVCGYCYHYDLARCDTCGDAELHFNLHDHDHYGEICHTCEDNLHACITCEADYLLADLNGEGNCAPCEENQELEVGQEDQPLTARLTVPCSDGTRRVINHEWSSALGEWVPAATSEDLQRLQELNVTFGIPPHIAERQAALNLRLDLSS